MPVIAWNTHFLDSKPEFPKSYHGTEVHFDKVKRMLTNVLYAGYLEFPKWDITLTKGQHEPLISYATYQVIQARLDERSVAPARKDISSDFPLRGFLICDACGHPLTACWAQSHTGQKHPYYLCQYRGCIEKGKSIRRDKLEDEFGARLKALVPARTTFELAESMFRIAWEERSCSVTSETTRLKSKGRQIDRDVESLLKKLVQTDRTSSMSAYENRIAELEREKAFIEGEVARIATPDHPFDEMFELSMRFLANPYEIWEKGDLNIKQTVLRLVFAQPLVVNRKTGVQTEETTFPFNALRFLEGTDCKVVLPEGLELPTPSYE